MGKKGGEITFLRLQLDGTTYFQWRHSDIPSFFLICVWCEISNMKKKPNNSILQQNRVKLISEYTRILAYSKINFTLFYCSI